MEMEYSAKVIKFNKVLNSLDKLAIKFCSVLDNHKIKYALVSGYVAILFGRSRSSEDIDIFIERISYSSFKMLWDGLSQAFGCINAFSPEEAYNEFITKGTAIRFAEEGEYVPNMEMKFTSKPLDEWVIANRLKVVLNKKTIYISPLELQIAYKLLLGSEKDIEDARHLFKLFKEHLDKSRLNDFIKMLEITKEMQRYLE